MGQDCHFPSVSAPKRRKAASALSLFPFFWIPKGISAAIGSSDEGGGCGPPRIPPWLSPSVLYVLWCYMVTKYLGLSRKSVASGEERHGELRLGGDRLSAEHRTNVFAFGAGQGGRGGLSFCPPPTSRFAGGNFLANNPAETTVKLGTNCSAN